MLRPIESNLSVYNVDQKASQIKDPNAHQFQAMQQDEINKRTLQEAQTVQKNDKSEGEVRVRDRKDDRGREGGEDKRGRKRGNSQDAPEGETDEASGAGDGHLNFLA
jgi:hypothetical protein